MDLGHHTQNTNNKQHKKQTTQKTRFYVSLIFCIYSPTSKQLDIHGQYTHVRAHMAIITKIFPHILGLMLPLNHQDYLHEPMIQNMLMIWPQNPKKEGEESPIAPTCEQPLIGGEGR